jgi:hypothetical protein
MIHMGSSSFQGCHVSIRGLVLLPWPPVVEIVQLPASQAVCVHSRRAAGRALIVLLQQTCDACSGPG